MSAPEPNKKVDALLRGYAKKRLAKHGSFDLDSVTKQQFHQEVRRTFRKRSRKKESWWSRLGGFWPQVAFCASVGVVLFFGIMFLVPDNHPEKTVAQIGTSPTDTASAPAPVLAEKTTAPVAASAPPPVPQIAAVNKSTPVNETPVKAEAPQPMTHPVAAVEKPAAKLKTAIATNVAAILAKAESPHASKTTADLSRRIETKADEQFRTKAFGNAASTPPPAAPPAVVAAPPTPKPKSVVVAQIDKDKESSGVLADASRSRLAQNYPSQVSPDRSQNAVSGNRKAVENYSSATQTKPAAPSVTTAQPAPTPVAIKVTPPPLKTAPATPPVQIASATRDEKKNVAKSAPAPAKQTPPAQIAQAKKLPEPKPATLAPVFKVTPPPVKTAPVAPPVQIATAPTKPATDANPNLFRLDTPAQPAPLTSFSVEHMDQTVRVKDADGTVYQGETIVVSTKPAKKKAKAKKDEKDSSFQTNYSFQVSGYNLNLRKNVVYTGNVLSDTTTAAKKITGLVEIGTMQSYQIEAGLK